MSLITAVSDSISRLGGEVSITADDHSVSARAIVEPLRYRHRIGRRQIYCKTVRDLLCARQGSLCLGDPRALR